MPRPVRRAVSRSSRGVCRANLDDGALCGQPMAADWTWDNVQRAQYCVLHDESMRRVNPDYLSEASHSYKVPQSRLDRLRVRLVRRVATWAQKQLTE